MAYKILKRLMRDQTDNMRDWLSYSEEFHKTMRDKMPESKSVDVVSIMGKLNHNIYQKR